MHIILVQVYMDDIIFGSTNKAWCDEFEVLMKGEFEMSAMGELAFFLGLQVKQLFDGIFISQDKYVKDMLKKFNMESVRTATTPYEVLKHKSKDEPDDAVNVHLFRSMIGSLMYLTASLPYIMFAVSACSRHHVSPLTSHLNAVKKIFKYLKGQPNLGLWYPRDSPFQLEAYSDSDYAGSHATSSTEAEYIAAASCCGQRVSKAAGCTGTPAGGLALLYKDDHNKVAYLEKGKGWEAYEQILDFLNRSHIRYALTHRPTMVFNSLVKQFWATATVRTLEAGPSAIIATIDGTEVVVTESLIRTQLQLDDVNGLYEFTFHDVLDGMREPTPDSLSPPFPPLSSAAVGPTTSSRPPSPSRHPYVLEDIREGGGDFVSSPQSNEALQTPVATAAGGAEDSAALTALSLKLDRCLHRVTTLENELGITKKVLGGVVLKLVTRVKRLEGLLQQRKRRLVLLDSEGEDATTTEQEFDLAALHTLASTTLGDNSSATDVGPDAETTMPVHSTSTTRRHLRKPFTSSVSAHVSETISAGVHVPAAATTIPAGSSLDAAIHAAAAPSSSIPTIADKGKAPMVDDSLPANLLSEQERMSDQHRRELDATQLIYTEAYWLDLLAKIATNSALSKQLLGDDITEENMNEWLGMLLLRKRRELAEQSRVKPMTKTQQRDYMRDFMKNSSAWVYNQGWTMKKVKALIIVQLRLEFEYIQKHLEQSNLLNFRRSTFHPKPTLDALPAKRANQGALQVPAVSSHDPAGVPVAPSIPADVSLPAATSSAPADIPVHVVAIAHAAVSVLVEPMVHPAESHMNDPLTAPAHGSSDPTVAAPPPDSGSDDDPLPYASYVSWEMVSSPLGSRLLGTVDALYQSKEPDTFDLLLWGDLHVLFQSLDDADALYFGRNQDSWRIRSMRLYPRAQVHVLEMVDGQVIHVFIDVSYPFSVGTLERMLKHGLEVSKLLVGGDLTMAE
nr:hypothetical protein [Tanacetum cinerariifolium]